MNQWNILTFSRKYFLSFYQKFNFFMEKNHFFLRHRIVQECSKLRFFSLQSASILTPFEKFRSEPSFYAVIHIYGRPFIVTEGDLVTLPQRLRDVKSGDMIRLNCVSKLGSRNYTLKGQPYINEKLFTCRARVLELTKAPMSYFIKKKRRQRRIKVVKSKQDYTVLRICEITIHDIA